MMVTMVDMMCYYYCYSLTQETNNTVSQIFYPSPNVSRPASQLTEEEQIKIAQRIGLIQHLPTGTFDGCKKNRE